MNAYGTINTVSYSLCNPYSFAALRLPSGRILYRTVQGGYHESLKWLKVTASEFECEVESVVFESRLGTERRSAA